MVFLQILLYPLSLFYQFLFYINRRTTKRSFLKTNLVISVGNLSVGGTGKTPFTIFLIESLQKLFPEQHYAILSRGYGGSWSSGNQEVKEDSPVQCSGDEPKLIKMNLPWVRVLVGKNRYESYKRLIPEQDKPIVVLDDGFQHFKIHRHMDIVLIDATKLLGNGFTIPAGLLRESLTSISRAEAVVFTRYREEEDSLISWNRLTKLRSSILENYPGIKIFHAYEERGLPRFWNEGWEERKIEDLEPTEVLAFCGLGNPKPFLNQLEKDLNNTISKKIFPDHYFYQEKDIRNLLSMNKRHYLCTEKDIVKLDNYKSEFSGRLGYIPIRTRIWENEQWMEFIKTSAEKYLYKHS